MVGLPIGLFVAFKSAIDEVANDAPIAARMLGRDGPRRYLVLAQNPAELRPAGGYTGTVGVVVFDNMVPRERSFVDVYKFDLKPGVPFVQPPDALANHLLGNQSWQLADATWSPDFPTAAQNALRLYSLESGDERIDGVIALNTYAIDRLLQVTGPIYVPEYDVTVAAGDVTLTAMSLTRGVSTPTSERKAFLNDLANLLLDRLQSLSPLALPQLMDAVSAMASERSLLAWFRDPEAERLVADSPLGGAVRRDAGDYLYVVEANVQPPSKYNLVVDRADTLAVHLNGSGDATSDLRMEWQNAALQPGEPYDSIRSYSASPNGLYGAYLRVLTPVSSQFVSVDGAGLDPVVQLEEASVEAGRNVFGNYLLMGPGASTLSYMWATPAAATYTGGTWTYQLTIQKQPGLRPMPLSVTVTLPAGATVEEVTSGAAVDGAGVTFDSRFDRDVQLTVRYRLP